MKEQLARLAKSALIYGLGEVLNRLVPVLLLPVFTFYLTPSDYGIAAILSVVGLFVTPVASLGFGAAAGVCYFEGNNHERKTATIWTAFIILIISVSFWTILGVLFAQQISVLAFQSSQYGYLVALTLLSIGLNILILPFTLYLQFEEKAKVFVALTTISVFFSISIQIFMVVVLEKGVQGLIEGELIARIISFTLFIIMVAFKIDFRLDTLLGQQLLRLGIPLVPSFAFLFVIQHGNKYILQWTAGLESAGIYTVGFNLGLGLSLIVSAFQRAWLPYFMSFIENRNEASTLFSRILTYYVLGIGTLSLLFYIVAKPAVMILTQPMFYEAYKVIGLAASAQFLIGVFNILLPGIYFAKEIRYVSLLQGGAALISMGSSLLLIPLLGVLGAGMALVMGVLAMVILQHAWNFGRRQIYLKVPYQWGRLVKFASLYVPFAALTLWERNLSLVTEFALSGTALFLLVIIFYILLNEQERRVLWVYAKQLVQILSLPMLLKLKPTERA